MTNDPDETKRKKAEAREDVALLIAFCFGMLLMLAAIKGWTFLP